MKKQKKKKKLRHGVICVATLARRNKKAEALQKWSDYLNEIKLLWIFNRDVVVEAV